MCGFITVLKNSLHAAALVPLILVEYKKMGLPSFVIELIAPCKVIERPYR